MLTDALARQDAISVRGTVISHLRRTATRGSIFDARRVKQATEEEGQR
jgi:hypothetical protein